MIRRRPATGLIAATLAAVSVTLIPPLHAQSPPPGNAPASAPAPGSGTGQAHDRAALDALDPGTYSLWQRHWRRFALKMVPFEGDYLALAAWEPRFPSSSHLTPDQYRKNKTVTVRERFSGAMTRPVEIVPPVEEGRMAAMAIPAMEPGHYGYIHAAKIVEVLGPEQMLIEDVRLVDERALRQAKDDMEVDLARKGGDSRDITEVVTKMFEAREAAADRQRERGFRQELRLVGFPTKGLHPDDAWPGGDKDLPVQIAVVGVESQGKEGFRSRRQRLLAVSADWFNKNLTEEQFADALAKRDMTPAQFVEQMILILQRERDVAVADEKMFAELERRRQAQLEAADAAARDKDR